MKMIDRTGCALLLAVAPALACAQTPAAPANQQPSPAEQAMIDAAQAAPPAFISAEQISDYIAEGRAAEAAGQPWQTKPPFMRSVGAVGPFVLSIEYRNIPAPDYTIHQTEYELFVVLEGSGSMRIGGELKDPFRYRRTNLASKVIVGGEERKISKGDVLMISPKTAHGVSQSDGKLVLLALHMPPPAAPEK